MATLAAGGDETEVRSRKPKESKFKQQALPAWQPILTAGTVLPTFFVIGVAFIPIGNYLVVLFEAWLLFNTVLSSIIKLLFKQIVSYLPFTY